MESFNWDNVALSSEIEYSKALKSESVEYPRFIHLFNPFVPWSGDFNRAVGVNISDFRSFEEVAGQIEEIHRAKALERPDRFDIYPPVLEESLWRDPLLQKGYDLSTAIFFFATAMEYDLPSEFRLENPPQEDYLEWYCQLVKSRGYFEEEWFRLVKPLQLHFINIFKPYWLLRENELIGWVYCVNFMNYARLFEVEISEKYRGKGMGNLLLQAIRAESYKKGAQFVLLQSGESLRKFYESAGFRECARNSIIWLRK
jgi:ribosomal protein S18 acetylase RimI-like enzyme